MKLKLDDAGHAVLKEGKPVYVQNDGTEVAFDAPGTVATISRLNGEAKSHREAKEAAEEKLRGFAGIEDPAKALKALETVSNLDAGKLVDASAVERVKAEAVKAYEEKAAQAAKASAEAIAKVSGERDGIQRQFHEALVGNAFNSSKYISEKIAIPGDMVQARFGSNFKIEGDKIIGRDKAGNIIYSKSRPGEVAEFEEALEIMVEAYPQRDHIIKNGASGSGAGNGAGNGKGGKVIKRADFEKLPHEERSAKMADGYRLE